MVRNQSLKCRLFSNGGLAQRRILRDQGVRNGELFHLALIKHPMGDQNIRLNSNPMEATNPNSTRARTLPTKILTLTHVPT